MIQIEITPGWIMTGISTLGVITCIIVLIRTRWTFKKQRKQLLEQIGEE